jgi:tRNA A37 threonylcarbamoyladenosine biosynthesis protein TsaE
MSTLHALPGTPETHFRLHWYGAIAHLRTLLPDPGPDNEASFLEAYYAELDAIGCEGGPAGWQQLVRAWEDGAADHLPLRALRERWQLDPPALTLLITAGLVEEDLRFGQLFETLNGLPGEWRPAFGLLSTWTQDDAARTAVLRLLDAGLLVPGDPSAPRARWGLQVPPVLWDAVRGGGSPPAGYTPTADLPAPGELVLDADTRHALDRLPALLPPGVPRTVLVRGPRGSGRRTLLRALARSLGLGTLDVAASDPVAGPLATALHALPIVELDASALPSHRGPIGVVAARRAALPAGTDALELSLGIPGPEARAALWAAALPNAPAAELAGRFRMPSGTICTIARRAAAECALAGRAVPDADDVLRALRGREAGELERLARRVPATGDWSELAVADETARELELLAARCRDRERLIDRVADALAAGLTPGVRALLTGPSGTGKTLAARLLAAMLGKELYAVDLSTVVDKYLGETEKNLDAVLTRAEELDVVLLLDEGDALLTRRTDVQTSNDRYANLETNFLLQRLEVYEGILLVTTNAGERIDQAFRRRMDVVIEFRAPDAVERWQIWRLHLPDDHEVDDGRLSEVAARCQLKGGQIRNAALHASLLALRADRPVGDDLLELAVRREYAKANLVCPLRVPEALGG